LTGTLLNGISEGAAYGDDAQMNSNYPLLRLTDGSGNVYYARTYNWSSTGVMTGTNVETTEFTLPANLPQGTYSLVVVANGIGSDPELFTLQGVPPQPSPIPSEPIRSGFIGSCCCSKIRSGSMNLHPGPGQPVRGNPPG
jgi:hypothetical protein